MKAVKRAGGELQAAACAVCTNGRSPPAGSGPLKPYTPTPILTLHPRQPTLLYFPTAKTLLTMYFTTYNQHYPTNTPNSHAILHNTTKFGDPD